MINKMTIGDNFMIHDSGLPPKKNRVVSKDLFYKA